MNRNEGGTVIGANMTLRALEEELRTMGISIVSSRRDTIISVRIQGLAGKALMLGLQLCDRLLQEKVKHVLKACGDPSKKRFTDPTFGPSTDDPYGARAMCKAGMVAPPQGGSQHQMKVLELLKKDKIRWERPEYAETVDSEDHADDEHIYSNGNGDSKDDYDAGDISNSEPVFSSEAKLFADGVNSGDVVQGNLGDCWFLSALSVVATRQDLLEQTFWRGDKHKSSGLFVCRFMKNFVWNYVIIDDRLPVYGFSRSRVGKPYFARCHDPNELWVSLVEKAYAKLNGNYESLIGGFVDVALNDITGMCSEQIIMKRGHPGFGEDPFAPLVPQQRVGDPFWQKIMRYKQTGTLMGCSIQPTPAPAGKVVAPESSAGHGLYFKHAYALVDLAEIKTTSNEAVRLIKLRNPWGMGEWTGPWSDSSTERETNQHVIEQYFKFLTRRVGGNASKRVFMTLNGQGELKVDEISQEEVIEVNTQDGTFFMSYDAWMQHFTHFFAGIDFPDQWHGRRVEGCWNENNCGGNTSKSTWINNPRFEFVLEERSLVFISLSQEDPRGCTNSKIVPIGFHICSLGSIGDGRDRSKKHELKEPPGKTDAYYRLYKESDRAKFQTGTSPETLPPAIIPGSVISGVDNDGVPQPAYTFKQAASVDLMMEPGTYCIVPSMYMRTDKSSGKPNVGNFWISVYSDKNKFRLEGGERIVEEEEGLDNDDDGNVSANISRLSTSTNSGSKNGFRRVSMISSGKRMSVTGSVAMETMPAMGQRRRFENAKDELLELAKAKGIGLREVNIEFARAASLHKSDVRRKLLSLGFKTDEFSDDKFNVLFNGLDEMSTGSIRAEHILNVFEAEIQEDQLSCQLPEIEEHDKSPNLHQEGVLTVELRGAKNLSLVRSDHVSTSSEVQRKIPLPVVAYSATENAFRRGLVRSICEREPALIRAARPLLRRNGWWASTFEMQQGRVGKGNGSALFNVSNPVQALYDALDAEILSLEEHRGGHFLHQDIHRDVQETNERLHSWGTNEINSSGITFRGYEANLEGKATALAAASEIPSTSTSTFSLMHRSNRMRDLELKRSQRLTALQKRKQDVRGDRERSAELPRLIGGRLSSSKEVECVDCGSRVMVHGRGSGVGHVEVSGIVCSGSNCTNTLCAPCHQRLPPMRKVCEDCFEHEVIPVEAFGGQLRTALIEKIGTSDGHRSRLDEIFQSFDKDHSGALSDNEFAQALTVLGIQPHLSSSQLDALIAQFDTNRDGEIGLDEFKDWIYKDQVWEPSAGERNPSSKITNASSNPLADVFNEVIQPMMESLLDAVCDAAMVTAAVSNWMVTENSTGKGAPHCEVKPVSTSNVERGCILFQRIMCIRTSEDNASNLMELNERNPVEQVFNRFDADSSGILELGEFMNLIATLGLQITRADATLLMHRVSRSHHHGRCVDLSEFRTYVDNLTKDDSMVTTMNHSLVPYLLAMHMIARGADTMKRSTLQEVVFHLHANMIDAEIRDWQRMLRSCTDLALTKSQVQRVANTFFFREWAPSITVDSSAQASIHGDTVPEEQRLAALNNSGDTLGYLLFSAPSVIAQLESFDVTIVCHQVRTHLEALAHTNAVVSIWTNVFGRTPDQVMDQRDFVDALIKSGFTMKESTNATNTTTNALLSRVRTKLQLALVVDELRNECNGFPIATSTSALPPFTRETHPYSFGLNEVSYSVFVVMLRRDQLNVIENKFAHALLHYLRFHGGDQHYLVSIALSDEQLIVRAVEPVFKQEMNFELQPAEYSRKAILQLSETQWPCNQNNTCSRDHEFMMNPRSLITSACYPKLHDAFLSLLSRFRVARRSDSVSASVAFDGSITPMYLKLIEDDAFVQTLRARLASVSPPVFWSVSPTSLTFAVDSEYLNQQQQAANFPQVVVERLTADSPNWGRTQSSGATAISGLRSLLLFTPSSLNVCFDTVGDQTVRTVLPWSTFQALLAGCQGSFALLELHPQGDSFLTSVAHGGGHSTSAPTWEFRQDIVLREPSRSDYRIDRPVVYTDTVRVATLPHATRRSDKKITFSSTTAPGSGGGGHLLVLNVRRALPDNPGESSHLYCTAYDPFSSSDYAVNGSPANWSVDFFNAAVHGDDVETRWQELLGEMSLAETLTPQLKIHVLASQGGRSAERLIGQCEISVASAIAQEGHIFDEWIALQDPDDASNTAGFVNVAFHFNAQKLREYDGDRSAMPSRPEMTAVEKSSALKDTEKREVSNTTSQIEATARLRELEKALSVTDSAKQDAEAQVRRLQVQLLQQRDIIQNEKRDEAEVNKWKQRMELVRRQQEAQQREYADRVAQLEAEIRQREEHAIQGAESKQRTQLLASSIAITNLRHASLTDTSSAHDLLTAMKEILINRSSERPYNGLKKSMASVAEVPGKVAVAAFDDVLSDFGLMPSPAQRLVLLALLDPDRRGLVNIADFFVKLCGDGDMPSAVHVRQQPPLPQSVSPLASPRTEQSSVVEASHSVMSPKTSPSRTSISPSRPQKLSWKEMRKFLLLRVPDGWETRFTEKGRPYFCNHADRSTQWKHPVPEVETIYSAWVKENSSAFQRMAGRGNHN